MSDDLRGLEDEELAARLRVVLERALASADTISAEFDGSDEARAASRAERDDTEAVLREAIRRLTPGPVIIEFIYHGTTRQERADTVAEAAQFLLWLDGVPVSIRDERGVVVWMADRPNFLASHDALERLAGIDD
jgi:hypothetical protein